MVWSFFTIELNNISEGTLDIKMLGEKQTVNSSVPYGFLIHDVTVGLCELLNQTTLANERVAACVGKIQTPNAFSQRHCM